MLGFVFFAKWDHFWRVGDYIAPNIPLVILGDRIRRTITDFYSV